MTDTTDLDSIELTTNVAGVVEVARVEQLTPRVRRVILHGEALAGLRDHWKSEMLIRLYFPPAGQTDPPEPYFEPEGTVGFRPAGDVEVSPFSPFSEDPLVRAFTARRFDEAALELTVDFVLHDNPGLASRWATAAAVGDRIGIVQFDEPPSHAPASERTADWFLLLVDEAALPALHTNLEAFPPATKVTAFVEVADAAEEQPVESAADVTLHWLHRGDAVPGTSGLLQAAAREFEWPDGKGFVWAAGEIKTVGEIRRFVREEHGLRRDSYKVQAYWRRGKTEVERMERMTELTLQAAAEDPDSFVESFDEMGMNVIDPTWYDE